MNEKEITTLAREYAEEMNPIGFYEGGNIAERNADLRIDKENAELFFEWLLRRFYLIKKSEVKHTLEAAKKALTNELERPAHGQWGLNRRNRQILNIQVAIGVLNHVFPEIAKEVES